ncbi:MAG TPA: SHOCT domain-containing protein [Anaerolineales bacterium]
MMGFGLILPLLLIAVIAYALGWRPQFNQQQPSENRRTPLEILKARYAGGEISQVEYEEMRRDLEG